jgi:proteic killer suppression protein
MAMIRSFGNKTTEALFQREETRHFPPDLRNKALMKLWMIHYATNLLDLRSPPANHLEMLSGRRKGQFSIRINDQWRICFQWRDNDAYEVEIVDYH